MISQISGTVEELSGNSLTVTVSGFSYEVFVPTAVLKSFNSALEKGRSVSLVTYHYHQTDQSKSIPILIGFAHRIEREFFERFITVSGVGPKAAVKALSEPIPAIAEAIDAGDLKFLKSLPGIGEQRAKEVIAKLQGKMGKFSLMQTRFSPEAPAGRVRAASEEESPVYREAVEILLQLQYKKDEAREMVRCAFARKTGMKDAEEVLNEVYRQRKEKA